VTANQIDGKGVERKDGERIKETESKREKPQYERAPEYHEEPK
jgi:hypothetical protein